ncbi:glutamine transport system substrate-binding protein [Salinibacillus kushneri]|uniref:Glutamine transport system substrate-binding protein n=1 Tax=Salinibacillus kushneri TaxID=237682 RepID=A0A1I0JID4_9BACI|nr:transporter substrate-binding domain-containing protein [Salinibacillus kushneri]SEU10055.1 glutamine transport system substrate-binding protein [Salinibacillus kushneri]
MKKNTLLIFAIFFGMLLLAACGSSESSSGSDGNSDSSGEEGNSEEESNHYIVATEPNFHPFEFMNTETGKMEGFDIDLMNAIAEEAGFTVEFETMEFDGVLGGMRTGKYPLAISGISITDERKEEIDFSDKYLDSGLILVVPEDSDIQSIDDVDGLKVGAQTGATSEIYLNENTDAEVSAFPEIVTAYQDLQQGRLDAVLYDLPNAQYYIKENPDAGLKTVGDLLQGEPYGIAFPKGSDLVEPVNEALAALKENGKYEEIYKKWFGTEPPE